MVWRVRTAANADCNGGEMKVALIGCGQWGRNLARVFNELGVLGMVCDPVIWNDCPVPVWSDVDFGCMSLAGIDAIAIATPAETHYDLALRALQAGKDVFVEKPMALSLEQGRALVTAAQAYDRILMVGHILEYHPAVVELIRQVHAGELGEIKYMYSNRLSLGRVREHEDVMWSFMPHDIAVMLRLRGIPDTVTATGTRNTAVLSLSWGEGTDAHIFASWEHPFKENRLVVVGSEKSLVFDGGYETLTEPSHNNLHHHWIRTPGTEPLLLECWAFVEACRTRVPPLADGISGLNVLNVLEHAQVSIKLGECTNLYGIKVG